MQSDKTPYQKSLCNFHNSNKVIIYLLIWGGFFSSILCIFYKGHCTCIFRHNIFQLHFASITLILLHYDFITIISFCDFTGNNSWNHLWTINRGTCSSESWQMVSGVYHRCRRELCWCYYLPKSECSKSSAVVK